MWGQLKPSRWGQLKPSEPEGRPLSTRDVAKIAGCSPTTAWRAIHGVKQTSAGLSPNGTPRFEHGPDAEADTLLQA
jgi:hypothetical protein